MSIDFDKITLRKNTNSFKWKALDMLYGEKDLYPMWVADMEFEASPAIRNRIRERAEEGIYGYELLSPQYYEAVRYWLDRRHDYPVEKDWILYCSTVMAGLSATLQALTEEGDGVLVNTPVYGNFFGTITGCGRKVTESPLVKKDGLWSFDLEDMERRVTPKTKIFLLCNPHNPVGRVWSRKELSEVMEFCARHRFIVISDEVHYDLIFEGKHTMAALAARPAGVSCVTLIAPSKTFNVAGIQTAGMIIEEESLRKEVSQKMKAMSYPFEHAFVEPVTVGGYLESEEWLEELLIYLKGNRDCFVRYVEENLPRLKVEPSQATYLMWVDCQGLGLDDDQLRRFWIEKCRLALSEGTEFGSAGRQYVRFNVACDRKSMLYALAQIRTALERGN